MRELRVSRSVDIDRTSDVVRRQFGDVAHHAAHGVHRGVEFGVIDEGDQCTYRQVASVGPLKLTQVFQLDRTEDGPLVNRIIEGPFSGGTITFHVETHGDRGTRVHAELAAPVAGVIRVIAPILRLQVGRQLHAALLEDKVDLESQSYDRRSGNAD